MIHVTKPQYSIQAPLGYENPFDLLDNHHMSQNSCYFSKHV